MPYLTFSDASLALPDQTPLISPFSLSLEPGLTGLVGANGSGKSTLLAAICGTVPLASGAITASSCPRLLAQLAPFQDARVVDLFEVSEAFDLLQQALGGAPVDTDLVDWALEEKLAAALSRVGLAVAPECPLAQLSGGQQRRAALAAVFFGAPEIVLLDEPTNDLDTEGRALVGDLLTAHRGIALVASHDRALLDRAAHILALETTGVQLFGGTWSDFAAEREAARARAADEIDRAEAALTRTRRGLQEAEMRRARRARQGKSLRDGSQSKMLLDKAKEGAEAGAAGQSRLASRQLGAAEERLDSARAQIERGKALGFQLPATGLPRNRLVLRCRDLEVRAGQGRGLLKAVSFEMRGPERLRLTGPNGAGKSTLMRMIAGLEQPQKGEISRPVGCTYLDQRLSHLGRAGSVLEVARRGLPELGEEPLRALLARFLFRNRDALKPMAGLSGGERLRLGLALALGRAAPPQLILLDEPTNHLDIVAIEAVEAALGEYDGALLVVSHDDRFAANLGLSREIAIEGTCLQDRPGPHS